LIKILRKNFELIFWVTALVALAVTHPATKGHLALCLFKLAGISWCPGCGIGHAISWLLHGSVTQSFKVHWLGIPALAVIIYRICCLSVYQLFTFKKTQPHGL